MIRLSAIACCAAAVIAFVSLTQSPSADAKPPAPGETDANRAALRRLLRDKPFPDAARDALNSRMQRHAMHMEKLMWSALVIDYASIDASAQAIAASPKIPRPAAGPGDPLGSLLPDRFFDLQDDLYSNAAALARAAKAKDKNGIAVAFSDLGMTCMSCHSLYLRIDP